MERSRRLAAVLTSAIAVSGAVFAAPASATTLPQLLSVSVSTTSVTAPGDVTVSYTASSDAPITTARALFLSPDQHGHYVTFTPGASGSGTLSVPDGVANGAWTLERVMLNTSPNSATGSSTCANTASPPPQCSAYMDFSADTVTVSGSTPDYNAPLISSVSVSGAVQPGNPVSISWVDDEVHTDSWVSFVFTNLDPHAQGDTVTFQSPYNTPLSTHQISMPLKPYAYNGVYQLTRLVIMDNLGNTASYLPDGTTVLSSGAVSPTSHALSFAAISFTVTGSTQGLDPPQLTSLHVTPPGAFMGLLDPIAIDYTTSDPTSTVALPQVTYISPEGTPVHAWGDSLGTPGRLWLDHRFGTYRLSQVQLRDDRGQVLIYRRDGTTYNPITGVVGRHFLNFPRYDVRLAVTAPTLLSAWPGPHSLTVKWSTDPNQASAGVTQTRITVNPGGYTIMAPPNTTQLPSQQYTVTGLRNGVTYTVSLVNIGPVNQESPPTRATLTPMMSDHIFSPGDENHDGRDDLLAYTPGTEPNVWLYARGGVAYTARTSFGGIPQVQRLAPAGGNGLFVVQPDGSLEEQIGIGDVFYDQMFGHGWDGMRFLAGGFDFNGSGMPDLYATSSVGNLYLYPVQKTDYGIRMLSRQLIGSGWGSMQTVFSPGDFNGDHKADLMAVDGSGNLWLYPGNGRGSFAPRVLAGTGWGGFGAVFPLRNFSGNGHMDIGAVDMAGNLYRYAGTGTGQFLRGRTLIGTHWNVYF